MRSDARVARARALIGAPFRLHGRTPEAGIDCVGLIAIAIRREGLAPTGYALRGGTVEGWRAAMDLAASRRRGARRAGDVLLFRAGPAQFHLGIWTGESLIHADARLRRVVETPGEPQWPVLGAWGRAKGDARWRRWFWARSERSSAGLRASCSAPRSVNASISAC